jgi:putative transposase
VSNKEHKKYLIYSKVWRLPIKIRFGQQISPIFLWQRIYVFDCDYWFAYKICFGTGVSNTMSADWCADILQETIQKYGVPEIFQYRSRKSIHQWGSHQCIIKQWNKNSMDGKEVCWQHFIERLWRQSNTRMYIYKHILMESAFIEDSKIILNLYTGEFISH